MQEPVTSRDAVANRPVAPGVRSIAAPIQVDLSNLDRELWDRAMSAYAGQPEKVLLEYRRLVEQKQTQTAEAKISSSVKGRFVAKSKARKKVRKRPAGKTENLDSRTPVSAARQQPEDIEQHEADSELYVQEDAEVEDPVEELGIPGISYEPQAPNVSVYADLGASAGMFEIKYHAVVVSDACVDLIYDTRFPYGSQWLPPNRGSDLITIHVAQRGQARQTFRVASVGLVRQLGELMVTTLVLAQEQEQEQEQSQNRSRSGESMSELDMDDVPAPRHLDVLGEPGPLTRDRDEHGHLW